MEAIISGINWLDDFIWGMPMIVLLLGTHLFMTVRTGFIQRKTFTGIRLSVRKDPEAPGDVSQFQALTTALASTIGTGNIIGVGTAIFLGGPGAVFWCWLAGVFGIATKYAESLIAVKYRVRTPDGRMQGGAMYALERGLNLKWLGVLFAALAALASFGIGCGTQINAIAEVIENNIQCLFTNVDVEGNFTNQGDGIQLGMWAGAQVQQSHAPMIHHMGGGADLAGVGVMGNAGFLNLDLNGKRFMNEDLPGQQLENQIELQPECTSFQLYDSKWGEEVPYMPANHGGLCYIIPEDEDESNPNYTDRQYTKISAKAEAYQFKADTLEDLLTQCGFEGDALDNALASVERYNELAKAGSDDDFGKPASRMFALENPPYYACQWGTTSMLVCVGGLESDENCHTFTEEDPASPKRDIIKGLYVCGNVQGSRYAVEYPICMRGISHSLCVYYGYIAGKNCVAGV